MLLPRLQHDPMLTNVTFQSSVTGYLGHIHAHEGQFYSLLPHTRLACLSCRLSVCPVACLSVCPVAESVIRLDSVAKFNTYHQMAVVSVPSKTLQNP